MHPQSIPKKMHPQRHRVRKKRPTTTSSSLEPSLPHDIIFFHILPKIPVRCLLRFNCVSKLWYNTIHHHPNFHATQLSYSKSNPSLVAMLCAKSPFIHIFQLLKEEEGGGGHHHHHHHHHHQLSTTTNNNIASLELDSGASIILGTCNGLTCIMLSDGIQICNPSTRELLNFPFPKPTTTQTERDAHMRIGFGFDHVMNEYKAIQIWLDYREYYDCMVYTLGTNKWRNVTATCNYPPNCCYPTDLGPLCMSGTLFWRTYRKGRILSFDLHHEKFHLIACPNVPPRLILHTLFELEGSLCLVYRYDDDLKDEIQLTLFTLKDQDSSSGGGPRWIKSGYIIRLPLKPDIKLIQVAEFAKHIYLNWITMDGHFILWDVNMKRWIHNKLLGLNTSQWILLVNHAENLVSLKTFVPPSSAGEVEVNYLSSKEAKHQQGEMKKKKRRRKLVYHSLGYLTNPYWLSTII